MDNTLTRDQAWEVLCTYNKAPFHIRHALTVEGIMRWFAVDLGYGSDEEFWGTVGLLHDVDFEQFPEQHCVKAPELLAAAGASPALIRAVCSHGYELTVNVKPEHEMEKVLYATDELSGLIWASALMRPSKSVQEIEVKSVKKKFKALNFAAGCSRPVIEKGADMLGWTLDTLVEKTILAMRSCEARVALYSPPET